MLSQEFIFSEKKSHRIKRHLLFWFCFWLFNTFLNAISPATPDTDYFSSIPIAALRTFQDIVPQIYFAYVLIALVLPGFLKSRYILPFLLLIFFVFTAGVFNFICMNYVFPSPPLFPPTGNIWLDFVNASKGTLVAATAICSFKLLKYWHLKEKRNLELLKEKTEAQLQLLTAQVHPDFLFNTLNNINSKAQNESPGSAKMIMELS